MKRTTVMILAAWCMALVISLPMHIYAPGFANFNVTDETLEVQDCMPPVLEESTERIYVLLLCRVYKGFMFKGICSVLQQSRILHPIRGHRISTACHFLQAETVPE